MVITFDRKRGGLQLQKHPLVGVGWWNNPLCVIGNSLLALMAIDVDLLRVIIRQCPYYRCTLYTCAVNGLQGSGM